MIQLTDAGISVQGSWPTIPKELYAEKNRVIETTYLELNATGTYILEVFKLNWYNIPDDEWVITPKDYLLYVSIK